MGNQQQYAREMMEKMTPEAYSFHKKYFQTVQNYLSIIPSPRKTSVLPDKKLLSLMVAAVVEPNPAAHYKHEPLRYKVYHFLFRWVPIWLRDLLIQKFINFPMY